MQVSGVVAILRPTVKHKLIMANIYAYKLYTCILPRPKKMRREGGRNGEEWQESYTYLPSKFSTRNVADNPTLSCNKLITWPEYSDDVLK